MQRTVCALLKTILAQCLPQILFFVLARTRNLARFGAGPYLCIFFSFLFISLSGKELVPVKTLSLMRCPGRPLVEPVGEKFSFLLRASRVSCMHRRACSTPARLCCSSRAVHPNCMPSACALYGAVVHAPLPQKTTAFCSWSSCRSCPR